jgi:hypothetical protein
VSRVVNLRTVRKQAARAGARADATAAAARHGESRQERDKRAAESAKAKAHLDGHRRDPDGVSD